MGFTTVKAGDEKQVRGTIIFGDQKTGKTTAAWERVEKLNPLFIVFGSADRLLDYPGATYVENPTLDELDAIAKQFTSKSADVKAFGAIVVDGLYQYSQMVLQKIVGTGTVEQRHWGNMSKQVTDTLLLLKRATPVFIATCLTEMPEGKTVRDAVINRQLFLTATPFFTNVVYCARRVDGTPPKAKYSVQTDSALAIEFRPGSFGN